MQSLNRSLVTLEMAKAFAPSPDEAAAIRAYEGWRRQTGRLAPKGLGDPEYQQARRHLEGCRDELCRLLGERGSPAKLDGVRYESKGVELFRSVETPRRRASA